MIFLTFLFALLQSSTYVGTSVTVVRMLITALVIALSIVISSAQNPSSECIAANETLLSNISCLFAYVELLNGTATDQQQMMVCDEGEECNTIIEDVIDECGDAVSLYLAIVSYILMICIVVSGMQSYQLLYSSFILSQHCMCNSAFSNTCSTVY